MTIDERIEALTEAIGRLSAKDVAQKERIDALVQSVELLVHDHREFSTTIEREHRDRLAAERQLNSAIQTIAAAHVTVAKSLDRAYDLLEQHERRISGLEGHHAA